jgi:hypothetical protein
MNFSQYEKRDLTGLSGHDRMMLTVKACAWLLRYAIHFIASATTNRAATT